jgi:diaminopimelate decarboxylase
MEWQIPGFLETKDNRLYVGGVNTVELAADYGTPLFVFSEGMIRRNIAELQNTFGQFDVKSRIFYASKANSNLSVLRVVRDTGLDCEVNSGGELYKAFKVGFAPDQIVFNGVAKTEAELREAIDREIFCINVDSAFELDRIIDLAELMRKRANIALRMVPGIEAGTHSGLETGALTSKFGMADDELNACYHKAINYAERVNLIGLHLHIGAQVTDASRYHNAMQVLVAKAQSLFHETGHKVRYLNLGGGFPASFIKSEDAYLRDSIISDPENPFGDVYGTLRARVSMKEFAEATFGQLEVDPSLHDFVNDICFMFEPGTRVIADTAILLSRIENYKNRPNGDAWLLLDAGFNVLLDNLAYTWYFHAVAANHAGEAAETPYKLGGPLCDGADVFHDIDDLRRLPTYRLLPEGMGAGDLIAFLDTGGYTLEQMHQYNGRPRPAAVMILESGDVRLIRRRETYDDLFLHDVD